MSLPIRAEGVESPTRDDRAFFGHPRGLSTLFFTEMWERFSYYGMRALLILFMTAAPAAGGLGFDTAAAGAVYGLYTSMVYMTSLPGGWIADRLIGQRRAVLYGGILIASGHFSMAVPSLTAFYLGLLLIVIGTGLLKANISVLVGRLYRPDDHRRDAGFSIYYMGINLGAFFSPLVCGYLGQRVNWHAGFAAAGVGMTFGLVQYVLGARYLGQAGLHPAPAESPAEAAALWQRAKLWGGVATVGLAAFGGLLYAGVLPITPRQIADAAGYLLLVTTVVFFAWLFLGGDWTPAERKRLYAIGVFFLAAALFWSEFEQAGSTLNLFADRSTRNSILGWSFPSSWFQSANALFIITFAPVFAWLWVHLGSREPSSPVKFSAGLIGVGAGFADTRAGCASERVRSARKPGVADGDLPDSHVRRAVSEPGRPQLDDQARAGAGRGLDDGRLVPRHRGRQLHRRTPGVALRVVSPAPPLRRGGLVRDRVRRPAAGVLARDRRHSWAR